MLTPKIINNSVLTPTKVQIIGPASFVLINYFNVYSFFFISNVQFDKKSFFFFLLMSDLRVAEHFFDQGVMKNLVMHKCLSLIN